jgi:hypothetical protein
VPSPVRFGDAAEPQTSLEFSSTDPIEPPNMLLGLTVENMHLASAARWWRTSDSQVAHAPQTVVDLDHWIIGCVSYLRREAGRCKVIASAA